MASPRYVLALGLAAATLAVVVINAIGNVALVFKVGPTPVLSIAAMVLAAGAFIVSWKQKSLIVSGLLVASGIIFMIPALNAMGYSLEAIVFPGPILGVIFGLVIFGLGVTKVIKTAKAVTAAP
ncbi:MAG TPA: hypothetical protein VGQ13_00725 [Nitrososphaera sp.]|jgi:hypothetical protein|nr:hypothetical protein [Nitrososphaera sp.]